MAQSQQAPAPKRVLQRRCSVAAATTGCFRWLLLLLLASGLAEASLARGSLAQPIPETVAEPVTESTAKSDATESMLRQETEPPAIAPVQDKSPDLEAIVIPMPQPVTEQSPDAAKRIYLVDDQVSFVPPLGFTAMSSAEIEANFSQETPPAYVYANADRDVSVGITVSDIPLEPEQLPEVKALLEDSLEDAFPGFQWLEQDFVNLDGQDWIKLEFLSQAVDQRIHNDMYITILEGRLLGFNFNANLSADPVLRPLLQDSRNSILLSPKMGEN